MKGSKYISFFKQKFNGQRELIFQTALSFVARIFSAFSAFIASVLIARFLGVEEAGLYFLAFSLVTVASAVSRAGLDNSIVRFVGFSAPNQQWGAVKDVIEKSFKITLFLSCIIALLFTFYADLISREVFLKPELSEVLKFIAPGIVGLALLTLTSMALQGARKILSSVFTLNISVNVILILGLFFIVTPSVTEVVIIYSCGAFLTFLIGYLILRRSFVNVDGTVSWSEIFNSCLPLWIVVIMQQTVLWSGQLFAGAWVETEQVAQLAVAQRTAMLVSFILIAVNMVVAPRFADMYKQGKLRELEKLALASVKLMVLFALPIVSVMLVFPQIFMSLFGKGFLGGEHLLQILVIGQFVNVITGSVCFLLSMSGHEKDLRNTALISGPIALFLGLVLTPIYGVTGSAVATAIAIAAQNLLAVWFVRKRLGFNTLAVWR